MVNEYIFSSEKNKGFISVVRYLRHLRLSVSPFLSFTMNISTLLHVQKWLESLASADGHDSYIFPYKSLEASESDPRKMVSRTIMHAWTRLPHLDV